MHPPHLCAQGGGICQMGLGAWDGTRGDVMDRGLAMPRDPHSGQTHCTEGMKPTSGSCSPPAAPQPPAVPPSPLPVTCMGAGMGTSVPTGACAPGQAALATGARRQTAAGRGGLAQPAGGQSKAPVLGVPQVSSRAWCSPCRAREPLFIAARSSPGGSLPMRKAVLWGIWQPSGVCLSPTEHNHKNRT